MIKWRNLDKTLQNLLGAAGLLSVGEIFHITGTSSSQFRTWLDERIAGDRHYSSIITAEAALAAGRNDVVLLHPDSNTLTGLLTWDTNYSHLIGTGAPTRVAQRSRVFMAAAGTTGAMLISATGCSFRNFYIFQGSSSDTDIYNVSVTGDRNYFENVHFAGIGHATSAARAGAMNLFLNGADENTFKECTIGLDTIVRTADNSVLAFDGVSSRNQFDRCHILSAAETASIALVEWVDTSGTDRFTVFRDCIFSNFWTNHAGTLNEVFTTGGAGTTKDVYLFNCAAYGIDEWQDDDAGIVLSNMPITGTGGGLGRQPTGTAGN